MCHVVGGAFSQWSLSKMAPTAICVGPWMQYSQVLNQGASLLHRTWSWHLQPPPPPSPSPRNGGNGRNCPNRSLDQAITGWGKMQGVLLPAPHFFQFGPRGEGSSGAKHQATGHSQCSPSLLSQPGRGGEQKQTFALERETVLQRRSSRLTPRRPLYGSGAFPPEETE